MSDNVKNFLYGRAGPWPQPSPQHPHGEAAAVLHLPDTQMRDWNCHIGLRYQRNLLTYWPVALFYALRNPHLEEVNEAEFADLLTNTVLSRFLDPTLDAGDQAAFAPYMQNPGPDTVFYKADFAVVEYVTAYKGMYITPSVTLFRKDGTQPAQALAMKINNVMITPANKNAWTVGKAVALEGATTRLILSLHPLLHFPMDAINAVTVSSLPVEHPVLQLMKPHLRFTLVLDNMVLNNEFSVLNNTRWFIYAPFVGNASGLRQLVVKGYNGIPGNSSYPAYKFPKEPPKIHSNYGVFLQEYYATVYSFVKKVVEKVPVNDPLILNWAEYIRPWVPGFPGCDEIFKDDNLARCLTSFIWDVSVAHSTDHYNISQIKLNKIPLRLRVPPPPAPDIPPPDTRKFNKMVDIFKYKMAMKMFFAPTNVTALHDTTYGFTDPELMKAGNDFLNDLRETEARLKNLTPTYAPLKSMSRSIQY
mgnify:CR=1 FL=1